MMKHRVGNRLPVGAQRFSFPRGMSHAGARGQSEFQPGYRDVPMAPECSIERIKACDACAAACEQFATACLSEGDVNMMAECIRVDRD